MQFLRSHWAALTVVFGVFMAGSAQAVTLTPNSLNFPDTLVGQSSAPQTISIGADISGSGDSIDSVSTTGPFSVTDDCGSFIVPGEPCTATIQFNPTVDGPAMGSLVVVSNGGQTDTATLSGNGIKPILDLNPQSLSFPDTVVGQSSAAQQIAVRNIGSAVLTISNLTISGDFTQSNNCPSTLAPMAQCEVQVVFQPTFRALHTGNLTVSSDGGTKTATLDGKGIGDNLEITPTSVNFPDTALGSSTVSSPVTITNTGDAPANNLEVFLSSVSEGRRAPAKATALGAFSETNNCPTTLAPNQSCTATVTFSPTAEGFFEAELVAVSDASFAVSYVNGYGVIAEVSLSPASLSFPTTDVGSSSSAMSTTLTNIGSAPVNISAISTSGDFSQSNDCPSTLGVEADCTINVIFGPVGAGTRNGQLTVSSSAGTKSATLSGTGNAIEPPVPPAEPNLQVSPGGLDFGGTNVGQSSATRSISVSNTGTANLSIANISISGAFSQSNGCPGTLTPSASCTIAVTFNPVQAGAASGTVTVATNAGTETVSLSGSGLQSMLQIGAGGNATFPDTAVGDSSSIGPFTISNTGTAPAGNLSIALSGGSPQTRIAKVSSGAFSESNNCPVTLAAGQSCSVSVTFAPTVAGSYSGQLLVNSDSGASALSLSATAQGGQLSVSPGNLSFPETSVLTSSAPLNVSVSNLGNASLTLGAISISGDYSQSNNCPSNLSAGQSCNVSVVFAPKDAGSRGGQLTVSSNFGDTAVSLDGSGDQPQQEDVEDVLDDFAGNDPEILATVGAIATACTEVGISDALRQDCQTLLTAAANGDPNTSQVLREITPERGVQHPRLTRNGALSQFQNLSVRLAELRGGGGSSVGGLSFRFGSQSINGAQMTSLVKALLGGGAGDDEVAFADSRWGVFLNGSISDGSKENTDQQSGLDFQTRGITLGADYRFTDNLVFGAAIGYMKTESDNNDDRGGVDTDGYSLSLYGTYYTDYATYVDFTALVGKNNFDQDRRIFYQLQGQDAVDQTATSDFDGTFYGLSVSAGYDFYQGGWSFGPRAGIEYLKTKADSYTESVSDPNAPGAGWAAQIDEIDQEFLTLQVGGRASYAISMNWGVLVPYAQLDWLHEFADGSSVVTGRFVQDASGSEFGIQTDEPDRNYFRLSLGGAATFADGLSAFFDFQTLLGSDLWKTSGISIGVRGEF